MLVVVVGPGKPARAKPGGLSRLAAGVVALGVGSPLTAVPVPASVALGILLVVFAGLVGLLLALRMMRIPVNE